MIRSSSSADYVLVIGDMMLDRDVVVESSQIDQTAPVVIGDVREVRHYAGGAGNVALNMAAMCVPTELLSLAADDQAGVLLRQTFAQHDASVRSLLGVTTVASAAETVVQTRWQDCRGYLIFRARQQAACPPRSDLLAAFMQLVNDKGMPTTIVLSDYGKGALNPSSLGRILDWAYKHDIPVVVDPDPRKAVSYHDFTVMLPNRAELLDIAARLGVLKATRHKSSDDISTRVLCDIAGELAMRYRHQSWHLGNIKPCNILATLGDAGMLLVHSDGEDAAGSSALEFPAAPLRAVSTCGAGDNAVAGLVYAIFESLTHGSTVSLAAAVPWAIAAAEAGVSNRGTHVVSLHELYARAGVSQSCRKICELTLAGQLAESAKRCGETIGVANGVFDLLHAGHLDMLEAAAAKCDRLFVLVNSDAATARIKQGRPYIPATARLRMLAALTCVDFVAEFDQDTPEAAIRLLCPDRLFKGCEFAGTIGNIPGAAFVISNGGRVLAVGRPVTSTTQIIERIRNAAEETAANSTETDSTGACL